MNFHDLKEPSDVIHSILESIAILIGAGWVLWRYILQRDNSSKIEFSLEAVPLGRFGDSILIELSALVTNRGAVRHHFKQFTFNLFTLAAGGALVEGEEKINYQVRFQGPIIKGRQWFPQKKWHYSFVDPGATQRFTYITKVPGDTACILVSSRFKYWDAGSAFHAAQRVFRVDSLPTSMPPARSASASA